MTKRHFSAKKRAENARTHKGNKDGQWVGLIQPEEGGEVVKTAQKLGMGSVADDLAAMRDFRPTRRR